MQISPAIFRAYDIRGVVTESLTPDVVREIGRAFASECQQRGQQTVVLARDGRLSGPALIGALTEGLLSTGCDVIDIGMVPTPVLYFATHSLKTGTGIMVTGSHNPPEYNGLKMMIGVIRYRVMVSPGCIGGSSVVISLVAKVSVANN